MLVLIGLLPCNCGADAHSPEQVVKRYALLVNAGQFNEAKNLCTPAAAAYLDALSALITNLEEGIDSSLVRVEAVQCTLNPDQQTAHCKGMIDDGFERTQETYFLKQENGQWWIDRQPETGTLQSSEETISTEETTQEQ